MSSASSAGRPRSRSGRAVGGIWYQGLTAGMVEVVEDSEGDGEGIGERARARVVIE